MSTEKQTKFYRFPRSNTFLAIADTGELLPIINQIITGWEFIPVTSPSKNSSLIHLERTARGYLRNSPWLIKPKLFSDPVDAVCDLIVDLIHAFIAGDNDLLCLHCAGIKFEQGLVIFPNTYKAGKSTLAVKLASLGIPIFSDDVVPYSISASKGVALGIQPRLRLPLPETFDDHYYDFIQSNVGTASKRYLYIDTPGEILTPFGEQAPITGIAILEYSEGAAPSMTVKSRGEVLKDVILRNFARQNTALNILDSLHSMVEQSTCYHLRYSTPEQAANLLIGVFGNSEISLR